eukprot:5117073-Karenia_brevis.AAC.1
MLPKELQESLKMAPKRFQDLTQITTPIKSNMSQTPSEPPQSPLRTPQNPSDPLRSHRKPFRNLSGSPWELCTTYSLHL